MGITSTFVVHMLSNLFSLIANGVVILVFIGLVALADVPSSVLFAGLDAFKSLVQNQTPWTVAILFASRIIFFAATGHVALFAIKGLGVKFPVLQSVTGLMTFVVVLVVQPAIQLRLTTIPASNWIGFRLGWVRNPALDDPMLLPAFAALVISAIWVNWILSKYSA
jgi:hypothetical protein